MCVRVPLLLSQTHGERNAGSGSIMHALPMLWTWSTAFVERISTSCALMVRYVHSTTMDIHCTLILCTWSVIVYSMYIRGCMLTDGLQVRRSRAYLDSLSMDGAEVVTLPLPFLTSTASTRGLAFLWESVTLQQRMAGVAAMRMR